MRSDHPNPALCRYCDQEHDVRYLCDAVISILALLQGDADSLTLPTVDFAEPIVGEAGDVLGFGAEGDAIVEQLFIYALTVEAGAGAWLPALVFTGTTPDGRELPKWLFAAEAANLRAVGDLTTDRIEAAIRGAGAVRDQGTQ